MADSSAMTATEAVHGISGEQLRGIDRYVVPMLLDTLGEASTATEIASRALRLRAGVIDLVRAEASRQSNRTAADFATAASGLTATCPREAGPAAPRDRSARP